MAYNTTGGWLDPTFPNALRKRTAVLAVKNGLVGFVSWVFNLNEGGVSPGVTITEVSKYASQSIVTLSFTVLQQCSFV